MNKDVIGVECLGGTVLRLTFEGNERREVDVSQLVPFEGVFEPLKDSDFFHKVRVEPDVGTIVWPNGADLCPDSLYSAGEECQ